MYCIAIYVEDIEKRRNVKNKHGIEEESQCHHNMCGKYCKILMKKRRECFREKRENSR